MGSAGAQKAKAGLNFVYSGAPTRWRIAWGKAYARFMRFSRSIAWGKAYASSIKAFSTPYVCTSSVLEMETVCLFMVRAHVEALARFVVASLQRLPADDASAVGRFIVQQSRPLCCK